MNKLVATSLLNSIVQATTTDFYVRDFYVRRGHAHRWGQNTSDYISWHIFSFFRAIVFNLSVIYNKIVHQAASSWHHDNYFAGLGNYLINFLPLLKTIVFIVYQIQNRTNYEVVIMCTSLYPGFYLRSRLAPPLHPPNL